MQKMRLVCLGLVLISTAGGATSLMGASATLAIAYRAKALTELASCIYLTRTCRTNYLSGV